MFDDMIHEAPDLARSPLLAGVRSGAWLDSQTFPPLTFHLPGIIPEGSTVLVGPPKVGKSWLVLSLALATATGGRALGLRVDQRPTFYLALEDGERRLQDRCHTLLHGEAIPSLDYLTRAEPGTVLDIIEAWLAEHQGSQPLVILDTLGKVMPPAEAGETTYQRDYRIGSALKALADNHPGSAIVTNHHDRKAGSDDFVERVSGTNAIAGAADTIVVVTRPRGEPEGTISVTGRDVSEGIYAVTFDGPTGSWNLDGNSLRESSEMAISRTTVVGLDERSRSIVAYVNTHAEGTRAADVAEDIGLDPDQTRAYLSRLYESGRIDKIARGLYGPVSNVSSVSTHDWNETDETLETPVLGGEST